VDRGGFVYILANRRQGALYIGVTSDLMKRISQRRQGLLPGFTRAYGIKRLVWLERHGDIAAAIAHEKQLKTWNRAWKVDLIEADNPDWRDLAVDVLGFEPLPFALVDGSGDGSRVRGDDDCAVFPPRSSLALLRTCPCVSCI